MATVRELQASFIAKANGLKSTIQGIKKDISSLQSESSKTSGKMSKDFAKSSADIGKSTSGIAKRIQTMSASAQKSFENIGKSVYSTGKRLESMGQGIKKTGNSLTNSITKPATVAAGALAGIALAKGFGRLVGIDTARAKLSGLGHDADSVEKIMNSALESVRGTAYGLDEAATTAAGAVAAGVKPGKELTRYLTITGDAAAIAGSNLSEMGPIFNKIQTSNKAYNDSLGQLADRGLPIYQWIEKEMGLVEGAAFDMASEGKISSEIFLKAIEKNIGGAAKIMGEKSFTAGLANVWAAVGRIGANFLDGGEKGKGFFSQLKPLMADFTERIDNMGDLAEKAGAKFGELFAGLVDKVKSIKSAYDDLSPAVQNIINKLAIFGTVLAVGIGPAIVAFGAFVGIIGKALKPLGFLFTGISKVFGVIGEKGLGGAVKTLAGRFSFLLGPVGIVIGIVTTLAGVFTYAYKKSESFRAGVDGIIESIKIAFENIGEFVEGIKGLFKDDGQAGRDILASLGFSDKFIETMDDIALKLSKFRSNVKGFIEGIKGLFKDDGQKGRDILSSLGLSDGTIAVLDDIALKLSIFRQNVKKFFGATVDFVKEKIKEMKSFWDSEGQAFLQAFKNIFSGIWKVTEPIISLIVSLIKKSLPVISTVFSVTFKLAYEIVKMVLQNIRGVIDGGLKIIMGLIRVFSGIFTGDFSKMWQGIKDIFSGAIQFIWNFVQLMFWGKLLKGVVGFVKGFSKPIGAMWTSIKDLFSRVINWIVEFVKNSFTKMKDTIAKISSGIQKGLDTAWNFILNIIKKVVQAIVDFVKSRFTTLKNNVTTIFNAVKKFITNVWNAIYSFFKTIIKSIVDFVKSRFNNLKTNITNIFNSIKNTVKSIWNGIKDNIINPITNAVKTGLNKFGEFKRKVTDTFKNIKNSVSDYVSDMVQKVKDMPGKMKDGIVKGAGKVYDGMKSLANKMVEGLGKGVNGVITGVNWVLGKLGVKEKSRLSKWKVPKYAKGTDGHPEDGPALINDGKGNNAGQELIVEPDGTMGMYEGKNVLAYLKKGTQVIPAKLTKEMIPKYAKGTGSIVKSVKKGAKKVAEWTGNIWDHIKNPSKLLDIALKTVGISTPDASDLVGKIAKGGFNFVKDKAVGFIKDKMENLFGGGDIPNVSGSGVQRWAGVARQALMMTKQYTEANLQRLLYQMKTESGGNPKAINLWDINAKRGIPSKGLMQVIDPTFQAYKMPGFNNIWNPLDNILASIRYAVSRYGSLARAYRGVGYADGGIVDTKQLAWIAEGGWAESIISHDPSKRVRQQRIWQETGDRLGFTDDKYSKQMLAELERIARSVEAGQRNITKAIENKPVLSGSDIKQEYDRRDSKEAINHSIFTGRPRR